ncbi:MAG: hypothetical protein AB7I48_05120, partial [Planctomycetaceae bacterium]
MSVTGNACAEGVVTVDHRDSDKFVRVPVGTHFRVWWFWLPFILSGMSLFVAAVLLPVAAPLGAAAGCLTLGLGAWTLVSYGVIVRGRRWVEFDDPNVRVIGRLGTFEFDLDRVTDLAVFRILHHAGGRFVAYSREVRLWIETPQGPSRLRWVNRIAPQGSDPLDELIGRLQRHLVRRAVDRLVRGERIGGEHWELDRETLRVTIAKRETSLAIAAMTALETIGQEVRIWREGVPRAVIRLPLSGRNTWMIEHLVSAVPGRSPAA